VTRGPRPPPTPRRGKSCGGGQLAAAGGGRQAPQGAMALRPVGSRGGSRGSSGTDKQLALGSTGTLQTSAASGPSGCRWVGGTAAKIDNQLLRKCTEGTEMGKIVELNFHFQFLQEIEGLEPYAANLRSLDLSSNNIRQMACLQGMAKLRELKLYSCQISRIQGLEQCSSLAALHLDDNQISVIEGLCHLRTLEYLNLDKNRIKKIGRSLGGRLPRLKEFHMSQNQLRDLDGLSGLSALEVFSANHNEVQDFSAEQLKGLGRLDELRLAGNQLLSLSFLSSGAGSTPSLPCLTTLDVSANTLTTGALSDLPLMHQVVEFNLADNHIEDLPVAVVTSFPSLEILDLTGNRIEKPEELSRLKELVSLRELLVHGNPLICDEEALYRVLSEVESLEYLDDKPMPAKPEIDNNDEPEVTFSKTAVPKALMDTTSSLGGTSSRPSTSSSRPGTAQSMKEAGVKDPLMHMRLKLSDRRFATEDQVVQWERQTIAGLAAIEAQIEKTSKMASNELANMDRFLEKADKVLRKQEELRRKGLLKSTITPVVEESDEGAEDSDALSSASPSQLPSRASRKLRAAVDSARGDGGSDEADLSPTPDPVVRAPAPVSPTTARLLAACDEEIEDEVMSDDAGAAEASPDGEEDEPAAEIDEEDLPTPAPARERRTSTSPRVGVLERRVDVHVASARRPRRAGSQRRTGSRGPTPVTTGRVR